MTSQPNLKRFWCVIGLMIVMVMLVAGLVVHRASANAISENKFPAPNARYISCPSVATRSNHPRPWLRIVVSHVISVATRLAV